MNVEHRERIGRAFSGARHYDRHAGVQRRVAEQLADRIAALNLPAAPRILEIGCGTGFLTEAMANRGIGGEWLVTDLSPAMVQRCRERMGAAPNLRFAVLDGEYGELDGEFDGWARFDLICANLAMQWFDNLESAVARLIGHLRPGGHLIFTTLAAGTFAEWRAAHAVEGLAAGTRQFPDFASLRAIHPRNQRAEPTVERHVEACDSARGFMADLKAIGAATPNDRHRPLPPGALRRVMRNFEEAGSVATYEVVTCHYGPAKVN